jgi:hypothetical protein
VGDQYPSLSAKAIGSIGHSLLETLVPILACVACVVAIVMRPRDGDRAVASTEQDALVAV